MRAMAAQKLLNIGEVERFVLRNWLRVELFVVCEGALFVYRFVRFTNQHHVVFNFINIFLYANLRNISIVNYFVWICSVV